MSNVITTLKKEIKKVEKEKKISNINIDFDRPIKEVFNKILKKFGTKFPVETQGLSTKEIESAIQSKLKTFNVKVLDVTEMTADSIGEIVVSSKYRKRDFLDSEIYSEPVKYPKMVKIYVSAKDKECMPFPLFTVPGIRTSHKKRIWKNHVDKSQFPEDELRFHTYDLNKLMSLLMVLDLTYQYLEIDDSFITNVDNQYYKMYEYSLDIKENLLNLDYIINFKDYIPEKIKYVVAEAILNMSYLASSIKHQKRYKKDLDSSYARSFETKKNIPKKCLKIMNSTKFLENFSFVEIDEMVELQNFKLIEAEFMNLKKATNIIDLINTPGNIPELRFRRLGQHNAAGIYYPDFKCVCIDIEHPGSFIHELGHHIDMTYKNSAMSDAFNFRTIAIEYKKALKMALDECTDEYTVKYVKNKLWYFFTPTEIFARCFEVYLVSQKGFKSSFVHNNVKSPLMLGFPKLTESFLEKINSYFSQIIKIDENVNITVSPKDLETELESAAKELAVAKKSNKTKQSNNSKKEIVEDKNNLDEKMSFTGIIGRVYPISLLQKVDEELIKVNGSRSAGAVSLKRKASTKKKASRRHNDFIQSSFIF